VDTRLIGKEYSYPSVTVTLVTQSYRFLNSCEKVTVTLGDADLQVFPSRRGCKKLLRFQRHQRHRHQK
jgi:hypothetical protein